MKAKRERIGPWLHQGAINRTAVEGWVKDLVPYEPKAMWREPPLNLKIQHETNASEYH